MAMTFRFLCSYANWFIHEEQRTDTNNVKENINHEENTSVPISNFNKSEKLSDSKLNLHYNIQIHKRKK
ncbi:hypothetical protein D7X25_30090 [bacterium 1XD42-8]|nr:hypothetical protein D7X25_30090 [bacterium 1XD42-8]